MPRLGLTRPAVNAAVQALLDAKTDKSIGTTRGDIIGFTASGTPVRRAIGSNGAALVANSSNSDGLAYEYGPQWFPTYKSGAYYFCNSPGSSATSGSLTNGTLRLAPWVVTKALSITRIGVEFTVAGDANSVYRIGIYGDDGSGYPSGAPILDAGTISTGTGNAGTVATGGPPGIYEITVSQSLNPGVYWVGGVVQAAATTQPTIRTVNLASMIAPVPSAAIPSTSATLLAFQLASQQGALPTWSGTTAAGTVPRIFFKVA